MNHLILLSQIGTCKNVSNQILVTLHLGMYQKVALVPHKINRAYLHNLICIFIFSTQIVSFLSGLPKLMKY